MEKTKVTETKKTVESKRPLWEALDGPGVKCDRFSPDNADAVRMMQFLMTQPKVRTRVPREAKEPIDACATVILNSLRINIRKGVSVDLPEEVSNIIEESYYATEKALAPKITNPFSGKVSEARVDLKSDAEAAQL